MNVTLLDPGAALLLLASVLAPLVVALFSRPKLDPNLKVGIAVAVATLFGIIAAVISGLIEEVPPDVIAWVGRILAYIALVVTLSQGFYKILKPQTDKIEANVGATDPPPA